jgi:glutathione S-transferase
MIDIYHCVSARSLRPVWMCEEIGLSYRLHMLPFPPRVLHKDYLAVNPLGTIPYLIDGPVSMTESSAMCQYLAARHGQGHWDVSPTHPDYGHYLNALHFGEATLTFPQTLLLRYGQFEPPERRQPQVVEDYARWFLARLKNLSHFLRGHDFVCGQRFTAADVSIGYALYLSTFLDLEPSWTEDVRAYWGRLVQRPALQRALQRETSAALEQGVDPRPAPLRPT